MFWNLLLSETINVLLHSKTDSILINCPNRNRLKRTWQTGRPAPPILPNDRHLWLVRITNLLHRIVLYYIMSARFYSQATVVVTFSEFSLHLWFISTRLMFNKILSLFKILPKTTNMVLHRCVIYITGNHGVWCQSDVSKVARAVLVNTIILTSGAEPQSQATALKSKTAKHWAVLTITWKTNAMNH